MLENLSVSRMKLMSIFSDSEINRRGLINRIERESKELPASVVLYRVCELLLYKWLDTRDYRFLNLLTKFKERRYFNFYQETSRAKRCVEILQILQDEYHYE